MSGMFWESEARPNICEAATGFTLSTIDLLVAIPMFLIDLAIATANNILREANTFNGTSGITYFKEKKGGFRKFNSVPFFTFRNWVDQPPPKMGTTFPIAKMNSLLVSK